MPMPPILNDADFVLLLIEGMTWIFHFTGASS